MNDLHLLLQSILTIIWLFVVHNLILSRKCLPLNLFGVMITSSVLMLYVVVTGTISFYYFESDPIWDRWQWYVVDGLFAIVFNKVINISKKFNNIITKISKVKTND